MKFTNEDGSLTLKGIDLMDEILNKGSNTATGERSYFDRWLAARNDNSRGYDLFNSASGLRGNTGRGEIIKEIDNLGVSDNTYSVAERFGGMDRVEVQNMFKSAKDTAAGFFPGADNTPGRYAFHIDNYSGFKQGIADVSSELETAIRTLGLEKTEDGMTAIRLLDSFSAMTDKDITDIIEKGVTETSFWKRLGVIAASTGAAAGTGALVGTMVAGPFGTAAGAASSAIVALISSSIGQIVAASKQRADNKEIRAANAAAFQKSITDALNGIFSATDPNGFMATVEQERIKRQGGE
jgi:hypothetical protein